MEDKALRGDQFALNLLNYMGSCWTVGPGSKTLQGGGEREGEEEEEGECWQGPFPVWKTHFSDTLAEFICE